MKSINTKDIKKMLFPLLFPVFILLFWSNTTGGKLMDLGWRDLLYTLDQFWQPKVEDVIIVAIDEVSFQQIGFRWPWPRALHGRITDYLYNAGASAVVFDILFPEPSQDPLDDKFFSEAIKRAGNVVLGANFTSIGRRNYETYFVEEPVIVLAEAASRVGMVNFYPDFDGSVRMGAKRINGRPSLALAALETARESEESGGGLKIKKSEFSDCDNVFCIEFAGKSRSVPVVSYYQVLNHMTPPDLFKNKIVLVGFQTGASVQVESGADSFPTPFLRFTKEMMFGVEIHANIIRTMIHGCPIKIVTTPLMELLFLILAFGTFFVRKKPVHLTLSTVGSLILLSGVSILLFRTEGYIFDVMPGMTAVSINGLLLGINEFRTSYREKARIKKAFSSYVAPDVVINVLQNYDNLKLGGEKKRLSVLFSDIRDFTSISEGLSPENLVRLLNIYLSRMTEKIFDHHGTLDKYIGDAIMVIFGAPVWFENHAENACRTALDMQAALLEMNKENSLESGVEFRIGIGINTGNMIVGNMGSERRFDYTVIGDEVNLASRLEGVTKLYNVSIIISEETRKDLGSEFICRELDLIRVKGKTKPIRIYELITTTLLSEQDEAVIKIFAMGLEAYRDQRWDEAISFFNKILELRPEDGPSLLFIQRCKTLKLSPPNKKWDAVWNMKIK